MGYWILDFRLIGDDVGSHNKKSDPFASEFRLKLRPFITPLIADIRRGSPRKTEAEVFHSEAPAGVNEKFDIQLRKRLASMPLVKLQRGVINLLKEESASSPFAPEPNFDKIFDLPRKKLESILFKNLILMMPSMDL